MRIKSWFIIQLRFLNDNKRKFRFAGEVSSIWLNQNQSLLHQIEEKEKYIYIHNFPTFSKRFLRLISRLATSLFSALLIRNVEAFPINYYTSHILYLHTLIEPLYGKETIPRFNFAPEGQGEYNGAEVKAKLSSWRRWQSKGKKERKREKWVVARFVYMRQSALWLVEREPGSWLGCVSTISPGYA